MRLSLTNYAVLLYGVCPSKLTRWAFEAIILFAGLGPDANVHLAALGILFTTHSLVFMVRLDVCMRLRGQALSCVHIGYWHCIIKQIL